MTNHFQLFVEQTAEHGVTTAVSPSCARPTDIGGSAILTVSPFGKDVAFRCDQVRPLGAKRDFRECSLPEAVAALQARSLTIIKCASLVENATGWQAVFDFLDDSMAQPSLIIAAGSINSQAWVEVLDIAGPGLQVAPADVEELAAILAIETLAPPEERLK